MMTYQPGHERTHRTGLFELGLPSDWRDRTIHVLMGPFEDDFQHLMTIQADDEAGSATLADYVDWQVRVREETLQGLRLLLKERVSLASGLPAYRLVFAWYPAESVRIYQEQVVLLHQGTGYQLSASFTRKTRRTLGPQVLRSMLAFEPLG